MKLKIKAKVLWKVVKIKIKQKSNKTKRKNKPNPSKLSNKKFFCQVILLAFNKRILKAFL